MGNNSYPDDDLLPPLWKLVQRSLTQSETVELKIQTIEKGMELLISRHADIMKALKDIQQWQRDKDISWTKTERIIVEHEKEIARIWAFPLKIAGAILAIFGASASVYGFLKWLMVRVKYGDVIH